MQIALSNSNLKVSKEDLSSITFQPTPSWHGSGFPSPPEGCKGEGSKQQVLGEKETSNHVLHLKYPILHPPLITTFFGIQTSTCGWLFFSFCGQLSFHSPIGKVCKVYSTWNSCRSCWVSLVKVEQCPCKSRTPQNFQKISELKSPCMCLITCTLPETNIGPENGWLGY